MSLVELPVNINRRPRVALVVQRYGLEVNGGAEMHARMVAKRMSAHFDIEVITTCAKDYTDWRCFYQPGVSKVDDILVRRFTSSIRNAGEMKKINSQIKYDWPVLWRRKLFALCNKWVPYADHFKQADLSRAWINNQGPYAPELRQYLIETQDQYDAFIFCTSLYYTTAACLPDVAKKSILVPHLHNETTTFYPIFKTVFAAAQKIICNTESEMRLVHQVFSESRNKSVVAGVGIDVADVDPNISLSNEDYILYLGRVCHGKNCGQLFRFFADFVSSTQSKIKLIVAGGANMELPEHPQIEYLGFVTEEVKSALLENARLLVIPSLYESLSIVLLESFSHKTPVLVNKKCEVLQEHILKSAAGEVYNDYKTFKKVLQQMLQDSDRRQEMGIAGYNYVKQYYSWDQFDQHYIDAVQSILQNNPHGVSYEYSKA